MDNAINPVITDFVKTFSKNQKAYEALCTAVEDRLKALMTHKGIMALVSSRVKDPARLERKLCQRDAARQIPYQNPQEIFEDIPDLIGARIALYFPGDILRVEEGLQERFTVLKTVVFPEPTDVQGDFTAYKRRRYPGYDNRRFDGYCAVHYRIRFDRQPPQLPHPITIEIQAASVLMHAWAEVEHDLAYKEMMGKVTQAEYACLDEINGLVMAGEIALNRLSQLSRSRIQSTQTFDTHYTMATYLSNWLKGSAHADHPLGEVKALYNSYKERGLLTQDHLVRQLNKLDHFWYENPDSLADQLMDQFGEKKNRKIVNKERARALLELNETELSEAQLGHFLGRWNALDRRIREALKQKNKDNLYRTTLNRLVEEEFLLSEDFGRQYRQLRMLRNQIVHGNLSPSVEDYHHIMAQIDELTGYLKTHYGVS